MLATVLGMNPKNIKYTNHDTHLTNLTFDSNFTSVVLCTHSSAILVAELPNGGGSIPVGITVLRYVDRLLVNL